MCKKTFVTVYIFIFAACGFSAINDFLLKKKIGWTNSAWRLEAEVNQVET